MLYFHSQQVDLLSKISIDTTLDGSKVKKKLACQQLILVEDVFEIVLQYM